MEFNTMAANNVTKKTMKRKSNPQKESSERCPASCSKQLKCENDKNGKKSKYFSAKDSKSKITKLTSKEETISDIEIQKTSPSRLSFDFYNVPCEQLARNLLGRVLVTEKDGERIAGAIVETEAYLGHDDKAAHSYKGKKTARTEAMFMPPGTAYVYNIYGMYCCINISAKGEGAAVLIRAVEPKENLSTMNKLRAKGKKGNDLLKYDGKGLCNGPSKLCQAFNINKDSFNKVDMCSSGEIWLEKGELIEPCKTVTSKRINIAYAEEWTDKLLRFYVKDNKFVSVRDKDAEKLMAST